MERLWPLTGRDAELRAITGALRTGAAGIVLAGPAGVGKTRLAREALACMTGGERRTLWAQCSTTTQPLPLGAFAGLVDLDTGEPARAVRDAVEQLGRDGPVVLAVDDAHLLDELSALVLHRLVFDRRAAVVVTLRTGHPAPDLVTSLWKDDHLARLSLAPLDAATTSTLVAQVLGGPIESRSALRLWHLTEGIPLFLRHLLAGEVTAGRMSSASGLWQWAERPGVSPELTTILEQQIGRLDPTVRDVVDLVSLAQPIDLTILQRLSSPKGVEDAESQSLIRIDGDPLVARLAHPLYGEVRRAAMGRVRARRLRGEVVTALGDAADPVARAVLMVDSDLDPDPDLLLTAAHRALGYFDLPLAERLARAASANGGWDARLLHASVLSWLSRGEEAETVLDELVQSAPGGSELAAAHLHRTANLLWVIRDADRAGAALRAAQSVPDPGVFGAGLISMGAAYAASVGDTDLALAVGRQGLTIDWLALETQWAALGLATVAAALSAVAAVQGRPALLDDAADLARLSGPAVPAAVPAFGLVDWQILGHRLAGRADAGRRLATRLQETCADLPGPARLMGLMLAGHAALAAGRVTEAITALEEAWTGLAPSGHEFRFRCRPLLGTAYGQAGRGAEARATLADPELHPAYRLLEPDDVIARAWAAAAEGSPSTAVNIAREAVHLAISQRSPAYVVLGWQTVVQLGGKVGSESLAAISIDSPRLTGLRAYAEAAATSNGAALLAASHQWEEVGDLVAAGDAAAQAATAFRREGRQGSALSAAARAEQLAASSGARTPALAASVQPLPLSAREREIATLAARGLSNKAIAEQLTLSVRTVEGHVYRLSAKLGITDRRLLADILVPAEHE